MFIMDGRPGTGKTKWAIMTAHIQEAILVTDESRSQINLLCNLLGVQRSKMRFVDTLDGLQGSNGSRVVLDLVRVGPGDVPEIQSRYRVEVIAITAARRPPKAQKEAGRE